MGYTTEFEGSLTITPPLPEKWVKYINAFSSIRHMRRDALALDGCKDDLRKAVGLPIGYEGEYYVGSHDDGNFGQAVMFGDEKDKSIISYNDHPSTQPGLWCQWVISDDGTELMWDGGEKFYEYQAWLEYIINHFMEPNGFRLNGEIDWCGEDVDDRGVIHVTDNEVETANYVIERPKFR